jgi:hypothetical protein
MRLVPGSQLADMPAFDAAPIDRGYGPAIRLGVPVADCIELVPEPSNWAGSAPHSGPPLKIENRNRAWSIKDAHIGRSGLAAAATATEIHALVLLSVWNAELQALCAAPAPAGLPQHRISSRC